MSVDSPAPSREGGGSSGLESHSQSDSYLASGYSRRMGWGLRPALLLVDVCRAYWTTGSPLDLSAHAPSAAAPEVMRRLLRAARSATGGVPVVWTTVAYSAHMDMRDAGLFWLKAKTLDVWKADETRGLADWVGGLIPIGDKADGSSDGHNAAIPELVIRKQYPSAFFATTLATDLRLLDVDTLVICGVSTSGCVRATALDAMCHGFRPMIVGSACGDRSDEIQKANLFDLDAKYADVVSEEEAIEHLLKPWVPRKVS